MHAARREDHPDHLVLGPTEKCLRDVCTKREYCLWHTHVRRWWHVANSRAWASQISPRGRRTYLHIIIDFRPTERVLRSPRTPSRLSLAAARVCDGSEKNMKRKTTHTQRFNTSRQWRTRDVLCGGWLGWETKSRRSRAQCPSVANDRRDDDDIICNCSTDFSHENAKNQL